MEGEYTHVLDAKGRLFIPSKIRDDLGSLFYVTISMEKCLTAYPSEHWKEFSGKVAALPYVQQRKLRPLFANAAKCELDAQGRILLPPNLRDFAELSKSVTIVGFNNRAELWDSESYVGIKEEETSPDNIRAVMEEFSF